MTIEQVFFVIICLTIACSLVTLAHSCLQAGKIAVLQRQLLKTVELLDRLSVAIISEVPGQSSSDTRQ